MSESKYIHGSRGTEQARLARLNALVNPSFLEFLQLDGARSVLEVGSGLGILTREVARAHPRAEVVGVENSRAQLEKAESRRRPNLRFELGDAHALRCEVDRFDVVYCRWLLEHVSDPVRVICEMRRVLKPGGGIFVLENDVSLQLFGLLTAAGFKDVEPSFAPEVYASGAPGFRTWIRNQIEIFKGCSEDLRKHGLATAKDTQSVVLELRRFLKRRNAATWFSWNRARSRK